MISQTPAVPYYAVIFTSYMSNETDGYDLMAEQMASLAESHDGFLGMESVRDNMGITISYWKDIDSIKAWKANSKHLVAQKYGKEKWYSQYKVRIAKVEHDYSL